MAFTIIDAENKIAEWISFITNVPIYFLDVSLGRPTGLYGMIKFFMATNVGTPSELLTPEDILGEPWVKNELNTNFTGVFSINFFRKGAMNAAVTLQNGCYLNLASEILYNANIGFVQFSSVQELSQVVEGNFEERVQMQGTFNLVGYSAENLNTITVVEIENISDNITNEVKI